MFEFGCGPREFAHIFSQFKRVGKNVTKFERARIHSTNNVFSAVAVVAAWGP